MVAAAHERVTNARGDFQHKLSRRSVDENQAIIVETLAVKNMLKNRKIARAISDAGWYSLLLKIAYKSVLAAFHQARSHREHFEDVLVLRPQGCRAVAGCTKTGHAPAAANETGSKRSRSSNFWRARKACS